MVGEAERQLEGALGDALVQVGHVVRGLLALAATDGQHAALDLQVQVFFLEAGGGDNDAILVVTVLFDVVGRVGTPGLIAQGRLEQIVEAIEAYGMTEQRGEGKSVAHCESPELSASTLMRNPSSASRTN